MARIVVDAGAPGHALLARPDLGGDAWWECVRQAGTPLYRPLDGGEIEVSFLWRDPMGGAAQSDYRRVYLDVYSHTPHPTEQLTSMHRLGHGDVWLWQTRLPDDWCGSYFLMPAKNHELPPAVSSDAAGAVRRWWIGLMATNAGADPLNRRPSHGGAWGLPLASICLPNAATHPAWRAPPAALRGTLQQRRWRSARLGNERDVWIYSSATGAHHAGTEAADLPLVVLLDGHYWARHMPLFGALDALTASAALAPAVYLLVDALDAGQRARELPCNPEFWLALQQELLPQMHALQAFTSAASRTVVAGQSYGGLAALYAALHWPARFGLVLSQSGSFWWPGAAVETNTNMDGAEGWLTRQVGAGVGTGPGSGTGLRILLEVGCYETDMIADNRAMRAALEAAGHALAYREFRGGHDGMCWRDGLLSGLSRLLQFKKTGI